MSRNGSGIYSLPTVYKAETGDLIVADQHNTPLEDIKDDLNAARPIVAGGTGATTASGARSALSVPSVSDVQTGYVPKVASKTDLSALDTASFKAAVVTEATREKLWMWKTGDFSTAEAADTDHVNYIAANGVSTSLGCWVAATGDGVTVRTIATGGTGADNASDARDNLGLGSAATTAASAYATAAQGALADSALQDASVFATAAQGALADGAIQSSATDASSFGFVAKKNDAPADPSKVLPTAERVDTETVYKVADRTALKSVDTTAHTVAYLMEAGREGTFKWDSSNLSTQVTADTQEGIYVAPSSDVTGASGAWVRLDLALIRPSWFGVKGDGTTDDTAAWQALANFVCLYGGRVLGDPKGVSVINSTITFQPQKNDGYAPPYTTTPSNIIFNLPGKPWFEMDLNGMVIKAGAAMTTMFHFAPNAGLASPEAAPFFARIKRGRFDGQGNATLGVHLDWCLGADVELNLIYGCASSLKVEGYGIHCIRKNELRFTTAGIDLTAGGGDSLYEQNDFYTGTGAIAGAACFLLGNAATTVPGQLRIFSNAATNEAQGTAYFIMADASTAAAIIRNVDVESNGVAGFDYLVYGVGKSGTNNLKFWTVHHNNALNYGAKTSLALVNTTETEGWIVSENEFNPPFGAGVRSSLIGIIMTNSIRDRVSGNYIVKCTQEGVRFDFANRSEISGNKIYDCGDSTHAGIALASSSQRNLVYGNTIDNDDTTNFCQTGIAEGTGGDYNVASLNMVNNVTTKYAHVGANTSFT